MCRINFDMDGTIANLYGVENWLEMLMAEDETPYAIAKPLVNLSLLARYLNRLQREGHEIAIISWLSKNSTEEYDNKVINAKKRWLANHLKSVQFDEIIIIPYGTPKENYAFADDDILFDDETPNRKNWTGKAFDETEIFNVLKSLLQVKAFLNWKAFPFRPGPKKVLDNALFMCYYNYRKRGNNYGNCYLQNT